MLKSSHVVLGVLALLAAGSIAVLVHVIIRPEPVAAIAPRPAAATAATEPAPYAPEAIGFSEVERPAVTDLAIADVDLDGLPDVLVCDASANRVGWIRQAPRGTWSETFVGDVVPAPQRLALVDTDHDGRLEVVVACRGRIDPTDDRAGRVVLIKGIGTANITTQVVLELVQPVTDLRALDRGKDGGVGLVIAANGVDSGDVYWLEQLATGGWRKEVVSGGVTPTAVAAHVGNHDQVEIAVLEAADRDLVRVHRRNAAGAFEPEIVWTAPRRQWAGSAIGWWDLNHDGRAELIVASGDRLERYPEPQPWHGIYWLSAGPEGSTANLIGGLPGCHAVAAADLDGDGHLDFVAASTGNRPLASDAMWTSLWLNAGPKSFRMLRLSNTPERIAALAIGDVDGRGVPAIVTGTYHPTVPTVPGSRVTLWRRL